MSRGLSDEDASKEMKKMVAFIIQEANEKAKEIKIKAEEEFNIEKAKLVRQETSAIETNFTRRLKQSDVKRKIALSNQLNKARLQVLQYRDECLSSIVEDAEKSVERVRENTAKYTELIEKLCLEAMFRLMESEVVFECLSEEVDLVNNCATKAAGQFTSTTGRKLNFSVAGTLTKESFGGVVCSCKNGRIRVSNTLKDRLHIMSEKVLPAVREMLFGPSKTRKFYN